MTTPLTEAREAEIRARVEKATPGPWGSGRDCFDAKEGWIAFVRNESLTLFGEFSPQNESDEAMAQALADAAFMSEARRDVPDLLTALDSERAKVAELVKALEKLKSEAEEWMHFDECGCSRTTECDEADGFRCAEHANPSDCPACECGRGTVVSIVDAALSRARQA